MSVSRTMENGYHHTHLQILDVNECNILGFCSQTCENYPGSYKCSCMRGYKPDLLNPDKCKVERGKVGIMFTHQTEIRLADATFHETVAVVENIRSAGALVIIQWSISFFISFL